MSIESSIIFPILIILLVSVLLLINTVTDLTLFEIYEGRNFILNIQKGSIEDYTAPTVLYEEHHCCTHVNRTYCVGSTFGIEETYQWITPRPTMFGFVEAVKQAWMP